MKKGKLMVAVMAFALVFVLTGCGSGGNKKLECKMSAASTDVNLYASFEGDKVTSMSLKYNMDLSNYSDSTISYYEKQDLCSTLSTSMSSYFKLTNCKQNLENKSMVVTSDIDIKSFKESDLSGSPEATKTALEKQGYSCELK